jgi:hypothetical protein
MAYRILLWAVIAAIPAAADELMPVAQQNALIAKYCTVCHADPASNGGLSLQRFDAAKAPASLIAMLLSKLTGGVPIQTAREASINTDAATLVARRMKSGAMGAAGIPIPDKATIDALIHAFALESAEAMEWNVERSASEVTASTAREAVSIYNETEAELYRLIVSCKQSTHDGFLQLSWSPMAHGGALNASVDGRAPVRFEVEETEMKGYGDGVAFKGLASVALAGLPLPAESLSIRDLFPQQTATFSFAGLPKDARQALSACFRAADSSNR